MALTDFWKKKEEEKSPYTPKIQPQRGPGGKFVATKKPADETTKKKPSEEPKIPITTHTAPDKAKGPFPIAYRSIDIRRYYFENKWYFSLEDAIAHLHTQPPLKSFADLKNEEDLSETIDKYTKVFDGVPCATGTGSAEILRQIIRKYQASFPGSILRWFEETAKLPFTISIAETPTEILPPQGNPSDRG